MYNVLSLYMFVKKYSMGRIGEEDPDGSIKPAGREYFEVSEGAIISTPA